jgi:hypothetical protein
MLRFFYRSTTTALVVLLAGVFLTFAAPRAVAFSGAETANDKLSNRASSNESKGATSASVSADTHPLTTTALNQPAQIEGASHSVQPGAAFKQILRVNFTKSVTTVTPPAAEDEPLPIPVPAPTPQSKQPLNTIPMTVGEKFNYFFKGSFLSIGAYGNAAFSGIRGEAFDTDHDPNGDHGNYFADAGTRAARSFAFGATSKFFERFAYASIFRQDPRYHRSGKKGVGAKIGYAVSRLVLTQGDKGGSQFNISYLGGGLTASYISKFWEREDRTTTRKILTKWATHISLTALTNIVKEFVGGQ